MLQRILNDTVAADQKSLDYNQAQYDTGIGDYISVAEAKTTLEAAESAAVNVGLLRAQYEHAIAMLIGKIPTDISIPVKPMVYTPPAIPTGVPSQLIERRPDVAAAERTLAEANATIGVGYGAFFPQVTLGASAGFESSDLAKLFQSSSSVWSLGPSVAQTIFNGWLYRAELHQYEAQYNADLATYRQSVLTAFQQVEDSMVATRVYSQQILKQQDAVKDAQDYLNLELIRYNTGVDPYVDVTLAQTTLLTNQETLNSLQVEEMTSAVELVQTLGGGWDRSQLPTPAQTGTKTTSADYKLQQ
jgi:NodT family efflux transporter outer membrane factor (OMF) lipoprotein